VAEQAACVYLCAREWKTQQQLDAGRGGLAANVQRRGMITRLTAAGGQHAHVQWHGLCVLCGLKQLGVLASHMH
jgi:hypothetical protein